MCVREGREAMEAETCQRDPIISAVNIAVTPRNERIKALRICLLTSSLDV